MPSEPTKQKPAEPQYRILSPSEIESLQQDKRQAIKTMDKLMEQEKTRG